MEPFPKVEKGVTMTNVGCGGKWIGGNLGKTRDVYVVGINSFTLVCVCGWDVQLSPKRFCLSGDNKLAPVASLGSS